MSFKPWRAPKCFDRSWALRNPGGVLEEFNRRTIDECFAANKGLVESIVKRYMMVGTAKGFDREDLIHSGYIALINACRTYNPQHMVEVGRETKPAEFSTYAYNAIRRAIRKQLYPHAHLPVVLGEAKKIRRAIKSLKERDDASALSPAEIAVEAKVDIEVVKRWLEGLPIIISGDAPVREDDSDTILDIQPSKTHTSKDAEERVLKAELASILKSVISRARLTEDEERVLVARLGLGDEMTPQPRARVAELLSDLYDSPRYAVRGSGRKLSGTRAEYLRDKIRILELRAARKIERVFKEHLVAGNS
jgi:RNA polymerase sigma factor (sigma-70 family)